jgi:hypothetical protein
MTDGIELDTDESTDAKPKDKDLLGTLMVALAIVSFGCLVAVLAMQILESRYMRGVDNPEDPYAAEALLPPRG